MTISLSPWVPIAIVGAILAGLGTGCTRVVEIADVAYDDRFGTATLMDVYLPDDDQTARPAVLLIHGGAWRYFDKEGMRAPATRLAGAGYVTASISYRLVPEAVFPEPAHDAMCALAFFRRRADEYGLDPARVAVMGYSAGAHLASLVGVASDVPELMPDCAAGAPAAPAAVISGAGPQDMFTMPEADAIVELLGGTAAEVPDAYRLASPISHVGADEPPFLFVHGSGDWFVDIAQSYDMRDALVAAGNGARILELRGGGHLALPGASGGDWELSVSTDTPEAWTVIDDFLAQTLGAP